jgi:hypothetical protein
MQGFTGVEQYSSDNAVGPSGQAVRVWAVNMLSGATAGQLVLRNGTTDSGTIWVREVGTANTGKTVTYGEYGILFPSGCFYDDDSNFTSVTFMISTEN